MPTKTGSVATAKTRIAICPTGKEPASASPVNQFRANPTMSGMVIIPAREVIAVSVMDRATSPRAMRVIMLEVIPPGQAARIITPTA